MILIDTQKEEFSKLKDIRVFGNVSEEEGFNGNLLVIGLGGMGTSVACALKGMLKEKIKPEDNINFLIMDSDIAAMEATIEESKTGIGFNALEILSIYRPNLTDILKNNNPKLARWMREDFPELEITTEGAKGNRQVGRLMFSNAYEDIRILLFEKLEELYSKSEGKGLDVVIISGIGGGTGSGILADVAYNVKAFGKAKKWTKYRVGGCLLTPDVLFADKKIFTNDELKSLMLANGCACIKEINRLMKLSDTQDTYTFESGDHRISMKENIFDTCTVVSGKKDSQGYVPAGVIYTDAAYFLYKLATNKYIGGQNDENRVLLRDEFFSNTGKESFKIVNEADYKIPIKEIENIFEKQVFLQAFDSLYDLPDQFTNVENCMGEAFDDLKRFFDEKPGDEIGLKANGLIKIGQYERPVYKAIKKKQDGLRSGLNRQLSEIKAEAPLIVKSIKNKLISSIEDKLQSYITEYGPFVVMEIIGSAGVGSRDTDRGMVLEVKKLSEIHKKYQSNNEYTRIVDSIMDIVSKRFFTFPSAKRETEQGYYDNCIKEALSTERNILMEAIDSQDVFGDTLRWLRNKAERLDEIYSQFGEDLKNAVCDLANEGKRTVSYLLKDAKQGEFLPSDYVTEQRIADIKDGIIHLMVDHEGDIDNGRVVPVKQKIEKIYKEAFLGIGVYAPEKLITVAFADKKPTLQDTNVMFVSAVNEKREEIMNRAAVSFVKGATEKVSKKKLCMLRSEKLESAGKKTYISLPAGMPHFSEAVRKILTAPPYNRPDESITVNQGELEISVDEIFEAVSVDMLEISAAMQEEYDKVDQEVYFGLHTDEVHFDNRTLAAIS